MRSLCLGVAVSVVLLSVSSPSGAVMPPAADDPDWEVVLPDEEEPLPEPGDFWIEAPDEWDAA
ncbi:MAG: hypothetical protein AAFV43_10480 [Planctomycetota bacterium]